MNRYLIAVAAAAIASLLRAQPGTQNPDPQGAIKDLERQVGSLQDQLVSAHSQFLKGVKVNGTALDPKSVMREAIYLTGGKLVEAQVAQFFVVEEVRKQIESGQHKPEDFEVSEADVLKELEPKMSEFAVQHPGIDFWEVVRTQYGLNRETFLQQRRQAIVFDRVFFPGSPKNWPTITKEAIMSNTNSGQGPQFMEQLEKTADAVDDKGNPRPLPEFWLQMMRQMVQKGLRNWSEIKYASNGLPPEIVLSVNGLEWRTDDAFEFVRKGLFVQDLERAMQEVVVREALRQELTKAGVYVSDEEFHTRYEAYRQPYDTTPFTVEVIATKFKGYPCLEAFRSRWRLMTSYGDLIKADLTDENLQAHADKHAAFFGDGSLNVDLIPFLGRDTQTFAWRPDGMQGAKTRCEAVFALLEKKEMTFDEALTTKGEYMANDDKRGRLGFLPLNQLKQQLRENEFSQLLDGYSVAEYLFYDAEVGKTIGPIQGADSWFIARVNSRTPAKKRLDAKNERDRELIREDYVGHRFMTWANEVMARTKIE
jgi:hypothetical protein